MINTKGSKKPAVKYSGFDLRDRRNGGHRPRKEAPAPRGAGAFVLVLVTEAYAVNCESGPVLSPKASVFTPMPLSMET